MRGIWSATPARGLVGIFRDGRRREVRCRTPPLNVSHEVSREFVFDENCFHVSRDDLAIYGNWGSTVIEQHAEQLVIVLPESVVQPACRCCEPQWLPRWSARRRSWRPGDR